MKWVMAPDLGFAAGFWSSWWNPWGEPSARMSSPVVGTVIDYVATLWLYVAMKRVGVAELKDNLSRHLREVEGGQEIEVTDHGRPVARIVPARSQLRLALKPALKPFAEIAHRRYSPLNLPVSSTELLRQDRNRR